METDAGKMHQSTLAEMTASSLSMTKLQPASACTYYLPRQLVTDGPGVNFCLLPGGAVYITTPALALPH